LLDIIRQKVCEERGLSGWGLGLGSGSGSGLGWGAQLRAAAADMTKEFVSSAQLYYGIATISSN